MLSRSETEQPDAGSGAIRAIPCGQSAEMSVRADQRSEEGGWAHGHEMAQKLQAERAMLGP